MANPSVHNIIGGRPRHKVVDSPCKFWKSTMLIDVPQCVQCVGVVSQQVVLEVCGPLNAYVSGLGSQRERLDTAKRPALDVAIQPAANIATLITRRKEVLESCFIYTDWKRRGGFLLFTHLATQLGHVMPCQFIGDVVKRRTHIGYRVSHSSRQIGWGRPMDPEPIRPPVRISTLTLNRPRLLTLKLRYALSYLVDMDGCAPKLCPPRRFRIN
jgi:hypothetical protein